MLVRSSGGGRGSGPHTAYGSPMWHAVHIACSQGAYGPSNSEVEQPCPKVRSSCKARCCLTSLLFPGQRTANIVAQLLSEFVFWNDSFEPSGRHWEQDT